MFLYRCLGVCLGMPRPGHACGLADRHHRRVGQVPLARNGISQSPRRSGRRMSQATAARSHRPLGTTPRRCPHRLGRKPSTGTRRTRSLPGCTRPACWLFAGRTSAGIYWTWAMLTCRCWRGRWPGLRPTRNAVRADPSGDRPSANPGARRPGRAVGLNQTLAGLRRPARRPTRTRPISSRAQRSGSGTGTAEVTRCPSVARPLPAVKP